MGRRQSWTDHRIMNSKHSNFRLPPAMNRFNEYDCWRRVKTAKIILRIDSVKVHYMLYKRRKTPKGYKWVQLRYVECKRETWLKWARFAIKIAPLLKKDCVG